MNRVLIAEDETRIATFLDQGLSAAGFKTRVVGDGQQALVEAATGEHDLLLLDIGLPIIDGFTVLRRLRQTRNEIPVIVLTARDSVADKVAGLEGGADDYLAKPFSFDELLARVRLRLRTDRNLDVTVLTVGSLALDLRSRRARVDGRAVELSSREFALAEAFCRHPDDILSREQLLSQVWGYDFDPGSNVVDVYVDICVGRSEQTGSRPSAAPATASSAPEQCAAASIALYAAAADITDGSFIGAADRATNELSSWTTVTPDAPVVPAAGKVSATVTITVPADAPAGEQYGVVWAEARSAADPAGGVTQVSRVGIRLYLSIGPGGPPATDFTIEALTAARGADGEPTVLATVRNTGGRALDMNGTLELSGGPGGLSAGPFTVSTGSTVPIDGTRPLSTVLDGQLPAGPWNARITLSSGLVERTASARITFPTSGKASAVATDAPGWPLRNTALAGLGVLLLAGLAIAVRRKRPRRRRGAHALTPQGA
jgi:DNA-binding response OmpR family regulator